MIDLVSKRYLFLLVSVIIIVPGLIAIALGGLKPGIDFKGGTRLTVFPMNEAANDTEKFKAALDGAGFTESLVKGGSIGEGGVFTPTISMDIAGIADLPDRERDDARSRLAETLVKANLVAGSAVTETLTINPTPVGAATGTVTSTVAPTGTVTGTTTAAGTTGDTGATGAPATETVGRYRLDEKAVVDDITVGPTVGRELIGRAFIAVLLASVAIAIYLTIVFRKVPNAFRYGVCAVIALIHDVLVVVGIFAILGLLFQVEIDALFITAMLTVIGFSVHDTIVVFDRTRENLGKRRFERFEDVVNYSVVQTLARSINTSITVILTLFALYLFGGGSIHNFVLALLIGIVSGTYSSIFNASMMLVIWENREWNKLFGGRNQTAVKGAAR